MKLVSRAVGRVRWRGVGLFEALINAPNQNLIELSAVAAGGTQFESSHVAGTRQT